MPVPPDPRPNPQDRAAQGPQPDEAAPGQTAARERELGGAPGPDPTRYGDWERAGRCVDF